LKGFATFDNQIAANAEKRGKRKTGGVLRPHPAFALFNPSPQSTALSKCKREEGRSPLTLMRPFALT